MAALIFQEDGIVTKAERKAAYSLYLRKVFYPLAVQMVEIIEKNSHLLCESHLPKIVSKYVAHVYLHRAIIECYEVQKDGQQSNTAEGFTYLNKTDFEEKLPQIAFDPETVLYFSLRYNYLRYYRLFLLGHLKHDKETIKRAVEKINHLIKSEDRGDIVQPYEIVDVEAWKKKHEDEATKLRTLHDGIRPRDSRSRSSLHSSSSVFFQSFLRREQGTDPGQQLARRGSVENV
ncbi:hypothetical protein OEZ85_013253 [Tetradesmus obliquus]|uniref:PCI domain-containing protein n=1 Tax=Tetradesmus obliquus TaxID=3088 RepID=A0ABY8U5E4_TETOB|nr:hypothetical protein OEZ85_013253 [Tetradesmus obliquus]